LIYKPISLLDSSVHGASCELTYLYHLFCLGPENYITMLRTPKILYKCSKQYGCSIHCRTISTSVSFRPQGDDSSPPPLCGLIFFEGDRCLCLTLKFVERLKCYSAKPNESCIIFGIYYFISCLISIVILSLCIFLFLLSFLVRYRVKTMQEKEKMCQTVA
jgi:hypothetical protein